MVITCASHAQGHESDPRPGYDLFLGTVASGGGVSSHADFMACIVCDVEKLQVTGQKAKWGSRNFVCDVYACVSMCVCLCVCVYVCESTCESTCVSMCVSMCVGVETSILGYWGA